MNRRRRTWLGLGVVVLIAVTACRGETLPETCAQGPLFTSARQRAERAVSELESTTSLELEESLIAIADRIAVMREVSPRSLRDPLGVLLAAYGQLVVAIDETGWNPSIAASDSKVAAARIAFSQDSVAQARTEVEDFLSDQCELARGAAVAGFALTGTTLPLPEFSEEPSNDVTEDDTVSPSELQAIGYAIAENYGVAIVATEAECIGATLGENFVNGSDQDVDDDEFFALVLSAFSVCEVGTPPTTTPNN